MSPRKNFRLGRSILQNRLKRVFPKFHADRSHPRGVNGLSKFSIFSKNEPPEKFFRLGRSFLQNRLKRVFPKFHANRSHPRGVNGLPKFSIFPKTVFTITLSDGPPQKWGSQQATDGQHRTQTCTALIQIFQVTRRVPGVRGAGMVWCSETVSEDAIER